MTKEEIQASIKSIMFSGSVCGIEIYACLRDESGYQTKKIRATDKLLSSTKDKVAGFINCTYLADDAEFDTSENIADNKKEFYEISLIENYRPFIFLDDAEKRTEYYSESDRNKLSGFLFRINLNDKYFWVYQHIYSVWRGWSILICTFNFFDFCAITFNQSHPGEDSRKVRISRL